MALIIPSPAPPVLQSDTFEIQRQKINNLATALTSPTYNTDLTYPYIHSVSFSYRSDDRMQLYCGAFGMAARGTYGNNSYTGYTFKAIYESAYSCYATYLNGSIYGYYGLPVQGMTLATDNAGGNDYYGLLYDVNGSALVIQFMTSSGVIKTHSYQTQSVTAPLRTNTYTSLAPTYGYAPVATIGIQGYALYINAVRGAAGLNAVTVMDMQYPGYVSEVYQNAIPNSPIGTRAYTNAFSSFTVT